MTNYHIINSLTRGGAEIQLFEYLKKSKHNNIVIILKKDNNDLLDLLTTINIQVFIYNLADYSILNLISFWKFLFYAKGNYYCWLYHSALLSSFPLFFKRNVFWLIHHAYPKDITFSFSLRLIVNALKPLSYIVPKNICFCSISGMKNHISFGFSKSKSLLINNGYDFNKFSQKKSRFTDTIKNKKGDIVLGMIARWHPVKDHEILLKAISKTKNYHLVLAGKDLNKENLELSIILNELDIQNKVTLLGQIEDPHEIYNDLDLTILTSKFEAFPNVMIESLASKTPFISFDIGDISMYLDEKFIIKERSEQGILDKLAEFQREIPIISSEVLDSFKSKFSIENLTKNLDNL